MTSDLPILRGCIGHGVDVGIIDKSLLGYGLINGKSRQTFVNENTQLNIFCRN